MPSPPRALLAATPAPAQKTDWPTRPVRFIVPFPPGGTVDPLARLVGARLTAALGQQFIVDNRPGASGSLGTAHRRESKPRRLHLRLRIRYSRRESCADPNLPFDTVKDLAPVMLVATAPDGDGHQRGKAVQELRAT